ncbi:unnamed protein product [Cylicocyclus nassatus]|uniref:Uncharacterized protein n=1 Tax=Cylicocyclus nassatus TaxID=53992 RepID=A0AA36H771_CYLNA|nr:unnamed protein product [Cylicocyclus nassatus]
MSPGRRICLDLFRRYPAERRSSRVPICRPTEEKIRAHLPVSSRRENQANRAHLFFRGEEPTQTEPTYRFLDKGGPRKRNPSTVEERASIIPHLSRKVGEEARGPVPSRGENQADRNYLAVPSRREPPGKLCLPDTQKKHSNRAYQPAHSRKSQANRAQISQTVPTCLPPTRELLKHNPLTASREEGKPRERNPSTEEEKASLLPRLSRKVNQADLKARRHAHKVQLLKTKEEAIIPRLLRQIS